MTVGLEALTVLVILLPGFVCAKLVQWLCVRPQQSDVDKLIEALLYSFIVYVIFTVTAGPITITSSHVLFLTVISIVLAFLVAFIWTNDTVGPLLRKLRITNKTTRPSVWNDVFAHYGGYVLVEFSDKRLVLGWVRYYSDYPNEPAIFLQDAAWVSPSGQQRPLEGAGVLITPECKIKTVSFHRPIDTRVAAEGKQDIAAGASI